MASAEPRRCALWHAYRGAEQQALEALVERFAASDQEHAPQSVRFDVLSIPYEAYASKLASAIPRGNGPALFIAAHERTGEWSRAGWIRPWELNQAPFERYHPRANEALDFDAKRWGVPLAYKSLVLFYNTDLIKAPPESVEQLVELARAHSDADTGRYGLVYEAANFYMHAPWLMASGGSVFDERGELALHSPEAAASLKLAFDLVHTWRVTPEDATGTLVAHLFNSGQAAFAISGPWFMGELDESLPYALAALPKSERTGLAASPFLTVDAAFVASGAGECEGPARSLARFLASDEGARVRALRGLQPVATLSAYDDEAIGQDARQRVFRRQLDSGRAAAQSSGDERRLGAGKPGAAPRAARRRGAERGAP